ncbi:MAG: Rnf-Nqr domain containing protein [Clostridiales bacterium]|nr:electron transport complex subunit RsxA [Eubacteriales bacterium]MCI7094675.1 electron transport complex subunit RsxA [Clostridiales bacterium]MDD6054167.1 Rnf-Nqr domain containing protein [Clostridiales bacterium]MDD7507049.1 Rnf-Nqr domain containing protein [Clostridiales bacterium]MDY5677194.1 Rnf-Nqr domain containing protein [Eubacteriales bacterium]
MANLLIIIVSAVFVNNFVVVQFLGICPFLGVSKKTESAFGMGVAVIFVMTVASLVCYCLYNYVLVPVGITYLKTIVFIFVIASLVQILEMVLKKFAPALYRSMGVYLPLITTNCAILGVAELNLTSAMVTNVLTATLNGFFSGIGFLLAIVLLSGVREKVDKLPIAKPLKGFPITMICACFMAMAFYVFGTVAL